MEYTINEIQDQIIEEFSVFDDWMDKYEYLIELGRDLETYDPKYKTDKYLIEGCQSRVWVYGIVENGVIRYFADSDAIITKGMISLLIRTLSGQKPVDIADAELYFIETIGLKDNLSLTRSNGLASMVKQMKIMAAENLACNG
ncbi:MAG: SufE family protein [Prevotellaceae bacterium]|jgi:cysteine desulfuration protein SufE|nr:SufE family protein [Prevotellaceae bacterium]